ncbi:hypothetical protein BU046_12790 [Staphylococcus simulans]|uniref:hypothetical protein n=1 Tax=Staphylococcus simulans TaxID=1286 RepID=UPI000D1DC89A|nr:hypothetical protein [Staphylococcus simulans]PTJ01911.1 hypothetical protein BU046_12790 [Staphylococcus simulans]
MSKLINSKIKKAFVGGLLVSTLTFTISPYIDAAEQSSNQSTQQSSEQGTSEEERMNVEYGLEQHEVYTYKEFVNSNDPNVVIDPNNLSDEELEKLGYSAQEVQNLRNTSESNDDGVSFRAASKQNWSRKFTTQQINAAIGLGANANTVAALLGRAVGGPIGAVASVVIATANNVLNLTGAKGIEVGGVSYLQKRNPRTGDKFKKPRRVYTPTWAKPYYK